MREPVFEVFARKTREEPLRHVGFVNAPGVDLARVFAWKTYDEQSWCEMWVVPRDAIVPVTGHERPAPRARADSASEIVRSVGTGSYGGSEIASGEGAG